MSNTDEDGYEDTGTFPGCKCGGDCDCRLKYYRDGIEPVERQPFRLGDVCKYVGDDFWTERHIIEGCQTVAPEVWEYSTDRGAWISHEDLELTEESSPSSRAELHRANEIERYGEYSED